MKGKRGENLEEVKKANNIGVVNGGQEIDLAIQTCLEARVEFGEEDLLHRHVIAGWWSLLRSPHGGE